MAIRHISYKEIRHIKHEVGNAQLAVTPPDKATHTLLQRERERKTDRERERKTDREKQRQRDRETERQRQRQRQRDRDRARQRQRLKDREVGLKCIIQA